MKFNGYFGECIKQYICDFHNIQGHTAADGVAVMADVYAMRYLNIRINETLLLAGGLHTNA